MICLHIYKGIYGLGNVAYTENYLGTVSRITLSLAVNFQIYFKDECPLEEEMINNN